MELLPLLCLCLLTRSGITSAQLNGPPLIKVEQDRDVVLPCSLSTKENIASGVFDWKKVAQKDAGEKEVFLYDKGKHYNNGRDGQSEQFKGRVSHFQDELKHGNASIIIRNTKISDSGNYTCYFPHLRPPQTFYIELVVGAAPKPSVNSLKETKDWRLLQCEVHGNPEPEVKWQDSAGNKLPAEKPQVEKIGDLFYITLNTTVTKSDRYRCVATQETISHQVSAETDVHISGSPTGWIIGLGLLLLLVAGVLAVLVYKGYIILNCKKCSANVQGPHSNIYVDPSNGMDQMPLKEKPSCEQKLITVKEGGDVTLPCFLITKEDLRSAQITWLKTDEGQLVFLYDKGHLYSDERPGQSGKFKDRVSHFPDKLEQGNASIIIRNMTRADSGDYRCIIQSIQKHQEIYIELFVVGSTPEPKEHHSLMMEERL